MIDPETIRNLIALVPAAVIAISFHEAMHGYAADRLGDHTARLEGRLTLNPLAHLDIIGSIIIPIALYLFAGFVFGYAKPVPVNPYNLRNPRRDMAIVAAAGPAVNLALAFVSAILLRVVGLFDMGSTLAQWIILPIAAFLALSIVVNVILACFNLIPIPPLDGGRILVGILPREWADAVSKVEPYGIMIVLILVLLDPFGIMRHTLFAINDGLLKLFMGTIAGVGSM